MSSTDQKLSVKEKFGYGLGDLASNLYWQMIAIFIAKYYTDVFMLGAATLGTMLLLTRVIDAFTDPVIGAIADRTNTRWGHFRPYLVWMCVPMALTAILTFTTPDLTGTAKVVYAYVTVSLMMLAYSAINIPYSALLGVLTPSSEERTSVCSYRFVMALIPVFIIVNTALPLAKFFGGDENSPLGWQMTMVVYSSIAVVLYLATFALTRERVQPEKQDSSLREDLRDLLRNKPWVVLCVVGIAALTYANMRSTVSIYYFEYVVPGGKPYFGPIMTTGAVAFILGVMATSPLSRRFGKRNFYMASMSLTALLTIAFYFVPPENLPLVWGVNSLINLCAAPTAPLVWAMYADTADYSEWKWGRRATGLVFSAASLAQKLGWAVGGAGTGWLLAYFGYVPNVAQDPRSINGITMMMSVIPALGAILAVAALWFYELDKTTVDQMTSDLVARRATRSDAETGAAGALQHPQAAPLPVAPQPIAAALHEEPGAATERRAGPATAYPGGAPSAPRHGAIESDDGRTAQPPLPLSPRERAALSDDFRRTLEAGVHGLCFSPYVEGQAPGSPVDAAQIRARLEIIRPYARWVRSFSCTEGHEHTPRIAHELGIRTLAGAWLGRDRELNEREIEGLIEVGRAGHANLVAVGNEVLLREDLTENELIGYIERVQRALPGIPVGYVDAYYLFEKHPAVTAACDLLLTNCYPFWEGCPREQAVAYMQDMYRRTLAVAGGKPVIVGETGWPDKGSAFRGAVPSTEGAMRYFVDTFSWAQQEGVELFYFAAFDEVWKVGTEGDVGASWGLWDKDGRPKYT